MKTSLKISIDSILTLFLISLAFFRVDFAGGNAPFLVTPQLIISLVVLVLFVLKKDILKIKLKRQSGNLVSGLLLILIYFFLSIVIGYSGILQLKKMVLFTEIIISTIAFLYLFMESNNKSSIIRSWIKATIIIQLIWLIVQLTLFFTNTHQSNTEAIELFNYINPFSSYVGHYLPRLNGGFLDPNVFSYYMSFIFFIGKYTKKIKPLESYFVILLVLLSFSRSGIASFLLVYVMSWFLNGPKINIKNAFTKLRFFLLFVALIFFVIYYFDLYERIYTALEVRFLKSSKSTSIHTEILIYGFFNAFESLKTTLFGHGFMSAPFYIYETFQEIGSQWKHINFHSDYATMIFETGVLGFALYYFTIGQLINNRKIKVLSLCVFALIMLQGIFYQQFNFHYFWVVIAITIQMTETKTVLIRSTIKP